MKLKDYFKTLYFKVAGGYCLLFLLTAVLMCVIIHERVRVEKLIEDEQEIRSLRSTILDVHREMAELSFAGESVINWKKTDYDRYHRHHQGVDSLLQVLKKNTDSEQSDRIDSIRHLLTQKEGCLHGMMLTMDEHIEMGNRLKRTSYPAIRDMVPEPQETKKRGGFLGLFGKKKEEPVVTPTPTVAQPNNRSIIKQQESIGREILAHADSLRTRNSELNAQLETLFYDLNEQSETTILRQEASIASLHKYCCLLTTILVVVFFLLLVSSYLLIHKDIKERMKIRRKLEESNRRNKELNIAQRNVMLAISHDLRTPLTSISGYADMVSNETDMEKCRCYGQSIRQSTDRMLSMLNRVLQFYRLDVGKEQAHNLPFRLKTLSESLQTEFIPYTEKKHFTFTVDDRMEDLVVSGDKEWILQIAGNLLCNAVKFTDEGEVRLQLAYAASTLTLIVSDTGTGMTEAQQERIFQPFERLENANIQDGFGLGLPITHHLVQQLGGTIALKSTPGKGSTFTVTLPLPLADATTSDLFSTPLYIRALAIDDDPVLLSMTRDMLERHGITCDGCTTVRDLMDKLRERTYDILITDIRMPEMSGFQLLELLRSSRVGNSRTIPVIAVTAHLGYEPEKFKEAGFVASLQKPYSASELFKKVKECAVNQPEEYPAVADFTTLLEGEKDRQEMLSLFIKETSRQMEELEDAVRKNDRETLSELVHHILPVWEMICIEHYLKGMFLLLRSDSGAKNEQIAEAVRPIIAAGQDAIRQAETLLEEEKQYE